MFGYSALTGDFETYKARNARRYVYYSAPHAAATLTGILSLAETENTDGPQFEWHEQRFKEKSAITADFASNGPWNTSAGTSGTSLTFAAGDTVRLKVTTENAAFDNWNIGERLCVHRAKNGAGALVNVYLRITAIDSTNSYFTCVIQDAVTLANNAATTNVAGVLITSQGAAFAEGSRSGGSHAQQFPVNPSNYTQIFRKAKAFSRTLLNQPMFFDEQGAYRTGMRDCAIAHLIEIENAILFGQRSSTAYTDTDGSSSIVRTMGGIRWFLEQWEAANGGTFTYRPGTSALTSNADRNKRIVQGSVAAGAVTLAEWESYEERMFRVCMTSTNEKLLIGGNGAIAAILKFYRTKGNGITINRDFEEQHKLALNLTTIQTDYGTMHLKAHPRFGDLDGLRNTVFALDVPNIKFRPMVGADTHKRENIQDNDFDGRKDEFFTEAGLEVNFPESHMILDNVQSIATT